MVDEAYTGEKFQKAVQSLIHADVEVVKRSDLHRFAVVPKRWIAERSFAWLESYRILYKNTERTLENARQIIVMSFLDILLKRFQTGSNKDKYSISDLCRCLKMPRSSYYYQAVEPVSETKFEEKFSLIAR